MPGFEVNRFIDLSESVAKYLICSICLNIFKNAIRSDCEHTFCSQCVEDSIKTNKNDCPECRNGFIKRKRNSTISSDDNTIIVSDFIFRTNLLVNNMINVLKIKCDYEWNGCQKVTELGLLSSHLKESEHRLCKTCEHPVGEDVEHNPQKCIELLKNDGNESKKKLNEINEINELNETNLKLNQTLNESKKKLKETNEKFNQLKEKCLKLEEKVKHLERLPPIPTTTSGLDGSIPELNLEAIEMYLGPHRATFRKLSLKSRSVYLFGVSATGSGSYRFNITIPISEIQELFYCLKPKNVIILRPKSEAYNIMKTLFETHSPNDHKSGVDSKDSENLFIIIKLKDNIDIFVSHLISRSKDMPELKVKEISPQEVNRFKERILMDIIILT